MKRAILFTVLATLVISSTPPAASQTPQLSVVESIPWEKCDFQLCSDRASQMADRWTVCKDNGISDDNCLGSIGCNGDFEYRGVHYCADATDSLPSSCDISTTKATFEYCTEKLVCNGVAGDCVQDCPYGFRECHFAPVCDSHDDTADCHCSYQDNSVFDPYEGIEIIDSGSVALSPYSGFNFDGFDNWSIIEDAGETSNVQPIDVTSGKLWARHTGSGDRGWTHTSNFRMLAVPEEEDTQWSDMKVSARFYPNYWQATSEGWAGLHLFARYQTEYDLYVVSLRHDGAIYIKRKWCGDYTKIASHVAKDANNEKLAVNGKLPLKKWYELAFSVQGDVATFTINGVQQFNLRRYNHGSVDLSQAWDLDADPIDVIPSGTAGIRLDYVSTYMDDFTVY